MNYLLALVGTLCLVGGIQADQLTDTINSNIAAALTSFNSSVAAINATITTANNNALKAWANWGNTTISNLTAINNRFKNYSNVDQTSLNNTISSIASQIAYANPQLIDTSMFDYYINPIYQQINATGNLLLSAAANMSSAVICTNDFAANCYKKYGANLTANPILLTRYNNCVTAENVRFANIGINMTAQISNSSAMIQTFLNLLDICNIPTQAATYAQPSPSTMCLNTFLSNLNRPPITTYGYLTTSVYEQASVIQFRIQRCGTLVSLDIQDTVARVQQQFTSCLSTGK